MEYGMSTYTISSDINLDQILSPAFTGGDHFIVNAGVTLTIRTDTRVHACSPASMVGTLGYINNYGKVLIDATEVKWMSFQDGASVVPPIGSVLTDNTGGSGILLGVWQQVYSAPVSPGSAMPSTGFIKFLNISSMFTGEDDIFYGATYICLPTSQARAGWIEVVGDSNQNAYFYYSITKEFEFKGDWFYLDNTDGKLEQEIYFPTNGSSTSGSYGSNLPGLWIETSPGTNEYEFWPALTSTNYFDTASLGMPINGTDERQKFVLSGPDKFSLAYLSFTSVTYSHTKITGKTYTESGGYLTISSSGHHFVPGDPVYLDFDAAGPGATFSGVYTVTSINSTNTFTVYIAGMSGTGSGSNLGHSSYCIVTKSSHGLPTTKQLTFSFDSHKSMGGDYFVYYKDTNTMRINFPYNGDASGNGQYGAQIGHLPPSGCKTRIPNIILRTADTSSRANNYANGGSSPYRWSHGSSGYPNGKITIDCVTGDHYFYLYYAPILTLKNSSFLRDFTVSHGTIREPVENCGFSRGVSSSVSFTEGNYVGFKNCVFANTLSLSNGNNATFEGCSFLSPRPTTLTGPQGKLYFENCNFVNFQLAPYADEVYFENCDFCSSASLGSYNQEWAYMSTTFWNTSTTWVGHTFSMNNITFGKNNTIDDQVFPYLTAVSYYETMILTNFGSPTNFIKSSGNVYRSSQWAPQYLSKPSVYAKNWRMQKIYAEYFHYDISGMATGIRSSTFADIHVSDQYYKYSYINARDNKNMNICTGTMSSSPTSSVQTFGYDKFGSNFFTVLSQTDNTKGDLYCAFMDPGENKRDYFVLGANTEEYRSQYGGIALTQVGQNVTLETPYKILSFSAFENTAPTLTGANTGNFTITYALKSGESYGAFKTLSAANLSAETIDPYLGFEMKIKVECATASTSNELRTIKIPMTTTSTYRYISYPLTDDICEDSGSTGECPTAEDIASAVRTNLTTELGLISSYIDAAISSRLASASYTTPPSANEVAEGVWDYEIPTTPISGSYGEKVDNLVVAPTAADVADAVWSEMMSGYAGLVGSTGFGLLNAYNGVVVSEAKIDIIDTVVDRIDTNVNDIELDTSVMQPIISANLDATVSSRLAAASYTTPPTAVAIADQVWDEPMAAHGSAGTAGFDLIGAYNYTFDIDDKVDTANSSINQLLLDVAAVPTALENTEAVWDALTASYVDAGSFGKKVGDLIVAPTAGDIADAVWDEAVIDHSGVGHLGSFGSLLEDVINAGITQLALDISDVADDVDQVLLDVALVPTAGENADAVWDEPVVDHLAPGTFGGKCGSIVALPPLQDIADVVWDTLIPVTPAVGSYGEKVDNLTIAPDAFAISAAVWDEPMGAHVVLNSFGEGFANLPENTADETRTELASELLLISTYLDEKISDVDDNVRTNLATELGKINTNLDEKVSNVDNNVWGFATRTITNEDAVVDKIWDEPLTKATHNVSQSSGQRLRHVASNVIIDGTAAGSGGEPNTIQLDVNASSVDGTYDPGLICIVGGSGVGQSRIILQYDGASKIAVVNRDWKVAIDNTSQYVIVGYADLRSVNEGRLRAATANSVQLNVNASDIDNTYRGQLIFLVSGTGQDQTGMVISYNGTTKIAVVESDWDTLPDDTTGYVMIPSSPVLLAATKHSGATIPTVEVSLVNL
jgi:hypothetical protein